MVPGGAWSIGFSQELFQALDTLGSPTGASLPADCPSPHQAAIPFSPAAWLPLLCIPNIPFP
jgi:hypothetical protein